ncbi:hypothetical protein PMKS-000501 [Pichia membranifaciens]|uniref:Protein BOI2 n=1 Tax=Pichia membranifaciens TaxID=4926 RepID=A0A1Q2YBY1_9ASCO|nr:hypothetical protein PMKS-000501 [Pichia membranifaciens]
MSVNNSSVNSHTQLYVVIKTFNARLPDELTIHEGDIVDLVSDDSEFDDGWYMGKNLSTGEVGLYPKVFTRIKRDLNEQPSGPRPSLLRSRSRKTPQGSPISPTAPTHFGNLSDSSARYHNNNSNSNINSGHYSRNGSSGNVNNSMNSNNSYNNRNGNGNSYSIPGNAFNCGPPNGVNRYVNDIDQALKELKMDKKEPFLSNASLFPNSRAANNSSSKNSNSINNTSNSNNNGSSNPLNLSDVANWTPEQVYQYFSKIVDHESAQKFITHKISGNILLELELSYLKELDISSFGTRFEIYKEIEHLRRVAANSEHYVAEPPQVNDDFSNMSQDSNYLPDNYKDLSHSTSHADLNLVKDNDSSDSSIPMKTKSYTASVNTKRFSQTQTQRPQSAVFERSSRFSRSTPSPLRAPSSTGSPYESQSDLQNVYEEQSVTGDSLKPTNSIPNTESGEQFASPRRAPKPPNYPSPVSNNPTKFGIRSPVEERFSTIPRLSHSGHKRNSSMGNASSIYVDTSPLTHSRATSDASNIDAVRSNHRRYSSIVSNGNEKNITSSPAYPSVATLQNERSMPVTQQQPTVSPIPPPNFKRTSTDNRRSVSAKEFAQIIKSKDVTKRVHSDAATAAASAAIAASPSQKKLDEGSSTSSTPVSANANNKSTLRQKVVRRPSKMQTSAFQEGIRQITPDEAKKDADYSGWMFKRGNLSIGSWKHRFFTLHRTRLSYYTSAKDLKEKGLIDITSHKVLPAIEAEDKLSAVYAATAGYGRYCFKLVPPAPGSRKGLTFTQQKVHYFAVETKEEMRAWMSALMKATIELDETVPAISSCVTPTIPLQKAQEMMVVARENARENFDNLQKMREEQTYNEDEFGNRERFEDPRNTYVGSSQDGSSYEEDDASQIVTSRIPGSATPSSTDSSVKKPRRIPSTASKPQSPLNGMSTPYLMTSGLISPNISGSTPSSNDTPARMGSTKVHAPTVTRLDDEPIQAPSPHPLSSSNSFSRRMLSLRKTSKEKEKE